MKKRIKNDEEIKNLDFKEIEYFINNLNELSLDQTLLLMNKSLKMKFDEQSIKNTKENV